jgi:hypothetical protein
VLPRSPFEPAPDGVFGRSIIPAPLVIPAGHKRFAHVAAGAIVVQTLLGVDPRYPTVGRGAPEAEGPERDSRWRRWR